MNLRILQLTGLLSVLGLFSATGAFAAEGSEADFNSAPAVRSSEDLIAKLGAKKTVYCTTETDVAIDPRDAGNMTCFFIEVKNKHHIMFLAINEVAVHTNKDGSKEPKDCVGDFIGNLTQSTDGLEDATQQNTPYGIILFGRIPSYGTTRVDDSGNIIIRYNGMTETSYVTFTRYTGKLASGWDWN
jgi:hypothetical protein